jgi:hypothetical protein
MVNGVDKYSLKDMIRQLNIQTSMTARFDTHISLANNDWWLVTGGIGEVKITNTVDGQVLARLDHRVSNIFSLWTKPSLTLQTVDSSRLLT